MVNANGERFVDEGADFRNYTYAKYGRAVLEQPGQFAWQVFDARVVHLLRDEYRIREVTKVVADTLETLAGKLEDVDPAGFVRTVQAYNAAVRTGVAFDPTVKDGRGTEGLEVPKSHWANPLDTPPYEAYAVTCGITFTFGGLRVDTRGRVLDTGERPIPGLYGAGSWSAGCSTSTIPEARASPRVRCSGASRAGPPACTQWGIEPATSGVAWPPGSRPADCSASTVPGARPRVGGHVGADRGPAERRTRTGGTWTAAGAGARHYRCGSRSSRLMGAACPVAAGCGAHATDTITYARHESRTATCPRTAEPNPITKQPSRNGSHTVPSSSSSHRSDGSNRMSAGATPSIHAPTLYAVKNIGATVIGLLIHAIATETGRLQRTTIETPAARTIWKGTGTHAMNRPFDTPHATELRFRCQRSVLNNVLPKDAA